MKTTAGLWTLLNLKERWKRQDRTAHQGAWCWLTQATQQVSWSIVSLFHEVGRRNESFPYRGFGTSDQQEGSPFGLNWCIQCYKQQLWKKNSIWAMEWSQLFSQLCFFRSGSNVWQHSRGHQVLRSKEADIIRGWSLSRQCVRWWSPVSLV